MQLAKLDLVSLSHEFPSFVISTSVRDLEVILDQKLSFAEHISSLTRSCFYQLRQLRVVSRSLSLFLFHCYLSSCFYSQPTILLLFSLSWPPLCSLATFGWCTQSRCQTDWWCPQVRPHW